MHITDDSLHCTAETNTCCKAVRLQFKRKSRLFKVINLKRFVKI